MQIELKNELYLRWHTMDGMNDRIDIAKEKINELEGIAVETVQNET